MKTTWTVEHDRTLGSIRIVIESTDPAMIRRVETAAHKNGIELIRVAVADPELPEMKPLTEAERERIRTEFTEPRD